MKTFLFQSARFFPFFSFSSIEEKKTSKSNPNQNASREAEKLFSRSLVPVFIGVVLVDKIGSDLEEDR